MLCIVTITTINIKSQIQQFSETGATKDRVDLSICVWEPGAALGLSNPRQATRAIWEKRGEDYVA